MDHSEKCMTSGKTNGFLNTHIFTGQPHLWHIIRPKWLQHTIRILGLLIWLVYPLLCLWSAEYINFFGYTSSNFAYSSIFESRPSIVLFDLIILYLASIILVLLFKRLSVSCIVLGVMSFAVSLASYLKFQVTGEYMYPWDFQQAGNVGTLTDYINTVIPREFVYLFVLLAVTALIVLISRVSVPVRWIIRVPTGIIIVLVICLTYSQPANASKLAADFGMDFFDGALQESNYVSNGFVGAFTLNILSSSTEEPDGYSEDAISSIMDRCEAATASDDFNSPDIILILQESFWDINKLPGCEFTRDPIENFHEITSRDGVYSGQFFTTAFGGGTVRPEFEVLTGLTTDYLPGGSIPYQYLSSSTDSYVMHLKSLGYSTLALHPYLSTFYMRSTKYPLIGFDGTYFSDELLAIEDVECKYRGSNISDETFVQYIEYFLEENDSPLFIFGISMEGHQPYPNKFTDEEFDIRVTNSQLNDELLNTVNQYTQCVADADRSIAELVSYIDNRDRDTILVVFGDHAPTLGANLAAYRATEFVPTDRAFNQEEREAMYSTPFLVYSNFELQDSDILKAGTDNSVASYNLLNGVMELIGAPRTEFMSFLADFYSASPNYNVRIGSTDPDVLNFANEHKLLTYDRIFGQNYSHED